MTSRGLKPAARVGIIVAAFMKRSTGVCSSQSHLHRVKSALVVFVLFRADRATREA